MEEKGLEALSDPEVAATLRKLVADVKSKKINKFTRNLKKMGRVRLGDILNEDQIQRLLDPHHLCEIIKNWEWEWADVVECIKTSKGTYISIDGMHTATSIYLMIMYSLYENPVNEDGTPFTGSPLDYVVNVQYIETDDLAHGRRLFARKNGQGKKSQGKYMEIQTAVLIHRLDKSATPAEQEIEKIISIFEEYNLAPVEIGSRLQHLPGAVTHCKNLLKYVGKPESARIFSMWHDRYWHNIPVDGKILLAFLHMCDEFKKAKVDITDSFLEELSGMIMEYFGTPEQFCLHADRAYKEWKEQNAGKDSTQRYALGMVGLYKHLGGTAIVPNNWLQPFVGVAKHFSFLNEIAKLEAA
tara:strand:+ start:1247 stop:2314 length:1068 start_codon:yes stop_codon:yes gene_type:complete